MIARLIITAATLALAGCSWDSTPLAGVADASGLLIVLLIVLVLLALGLGFLACIAWERWQRRRRERKHTFTEPDDVEDDVPM